MVWKLKISWLPNEAKTGRRNKNSCHPSGGLQRKILLYNWDDDKKGRANMAMVWRILLKSDLTDSPNYGKYCLKNKIVAMGWILDKLNPDIASGKIKISNFADFEACAKAEGMDCNQIRRLAEEIKAGDFIWAYVGGKYYLAQVSADSRYRYNADSEAVSYRACNQLTNIDWKCVGEYKDVDEKVASRLQRGQVLERLFADDNSDFAFGLQYTQEVFAKLSCKKTALYGAILGDIIGVPYEFDRNKPSSRDSFPLFCRESNFSDDTVTTIAVADAILKSGDEEDGRIFFKTLVETLQAWCQKYPSRGYGRSFRRWIVDKNPQPYNSYGNGAAMRVSASGCGQIILLLQESRAWENRPVPFLELSDCRQKAPFK